MKIIAGDRLFCDTNVLLCAIDKQRRLNRQALQVLNEFPNNGVELCISGQVLREFFTVSTRPTSVNGLGQSPNDTLANIEAILDRSTLIEETRGVTERLIEMVTHNSIAGKQIHDANIAATMLANGVNRLVTDNLEHFRRFEEIDLLDLGAV